MPIDKTENAEQKKSLIEVIYERFKAEPLADFVVFDIVELMKKSGITDFDVLEKKLNKIKEELKPDFEYHLNQFVPRLKDDQFIGSNQGIKIVVDDKKKLAKYYAGSFNQPLHLSEYEIEFSDNEHLIAVADRKSILPNVLNEHFLCRAMFKSPPQVAIDWSIIYEEMTGVDPLMNGEHVASRQQISARTRMVKDAMYTVNERLEKDINTKDELFSWENKSVTRNF